jgi:hypothetical protein
VLELYKIVSRCVNQLTSDGGSDIVGSEFHDYGVIGAALVIVKPERITTPVPFQPIKSNPSPPTVQPIDAIVLDRVPDLTPATRSNS